jgi:hypothetical protein
VGVGTSKNVGGAPSRGGQHGGQGDGRLPPPSQIRACEITALGSSDMTHRTGPGPSDIGPLERVRHQKLLPGVRAVLPVRDAIYAHARLLPQTVIGAVQRRHRQKVSDRGELHLLLPPSQFGYSVEFRGHACSVSVYRHVSLDQSVGLHLSRLETSSAGVAVAPRLVQPFGVGARIFAAGDVKGPKTRRATSGSRSG